MRRADWIIGAMCAGLLLSGGAAFGQGSEPGFPLPAAAASQERSDQDFLEKALGVNELELRLGRLAAERAIAPGVKAMGLKMAGRHGELGLQLSRLAREAGGSGMAVMSAEQRATLERVSAQPGDAFDTTFKQTVDAGHIQELGMYRDEVGKAVNPQLCALAQDRVVKLQEAVAKVEAPKQQARQEW